MTQSFVDELIPRIEQLKNCRSLGGLAHILGYKPQSLSYILYKIPDESKYSEFEIPKKSGFLDIEGISNKICVRNQDNPDMTLNPNQNFLKV